RSQPRVMQLQPVDVVAAEPSQAAFDFLADEGWREILGVLSLAALPLVAGPVVAHLGGEDAAVTHVTEGGVEDRFAVAVAVDRGSVEEGDAEVVGEAKQAHGLVLRVIAPPAGRQRPEAEADLRHLDAGLAQLAISHEGPDPGERRPRGRSS